MIPLAPLPISVLILTHNEEENIEACLQSVAGWASKIFVVDSGSSDRTLEIVERYADDVLHHPFTSWGTQINWALENLPITTPWLLRLDADEYVLPELRDELSATLPTLPAEVSSLYLKRRIIFLGRWIRYGGVYPFWLLRVFRPGQVRFEQHSGESEHAVVLQGTSRYLTHDIVDHNRKDLSFWTAKHEGYARRELISYKRSLQEEADDYLKSRGKAFGTPEMRRRWLKGNLYDRSPLFARAFFYFIFRYVIQRGFLDGVEGLIFHFLQAGWYRFYVDAKIWEARKVGQL